MKDHKIGVVDASILFEEKEYEKGMFLVGHNYFITGILSLDNEYVLTASADTSIKLWSLLTGEIV
jgi:WD40 repeat protein